MKKLILILSLVVTLPAFAAGGGNAHLDEVDIDLGDKESLQNGARLFVNYCLSCHSASFMRYQRMADDLDIPHKVVEENMMFAADRIGGLMKTTMPEEDAKVWFGKAPPDLSLIARSRGPEWVYTYLRTFYLDENSPSGWNNGESDSPGTVTSPSIARVTLPSTCLKFNPLSVKKPKWTSEGSE